MTLPREKYNPELIELERQEMWNNDAIHKVSEDPNKEKSFIVDMFPYPSGHGIHEGHVKNYTATDVLGRMRARQGMSVLHPMGYDSFGLPAENYAIMTGTHPRDAVKSRVERFGKQLRRLGFAYDWDREINTIDPEFVRWTQEGFLILFEKGLAKEEEAPVNWCPEDQTILSNEDLDDTGCCERCGSQVERRLQRQWSVHITDYAEDLLNGMESLTGWEKHILDMQREWIGKREGWKFATKAIGENDETVESIEVFVENLTDISNADFLAVSPEQFENLHIDDLISAAQAKELEDYVKQNKFKSDKSRSLKNGIEVHSVRIKVPFTDKLIPLFVSEYVTPSGDNGVLFGNIRRNERDFKFLKNMGHIEENEEFQLDKSQQISEVILDLLNKEQLPTTSIYRLQDWVFSRQRFWGEPIPIIHCGDCGPVAVPRNELPVLLPEVVSYKPTGTGESPLAEVEDWVNTCCPDCNKPAKRETNTMPQWAGSSWYWHRYKDPHNSKVLVDPQKDRYWGQVDMYVGGAEHATRHLIYARFWNMVLQDAGVVIEREPFANFQHIGLVMDEKGVKISKRLNNGVDLDKVVETHGADALRLGVMQMGEFAKNTNWSPREIESASRFLGRIWNMQYDVAWGTDDKLDDETTRKINDTIKRVTNDIERFKFNTAIAAIRELANFLSKKDTILPEEYSVVLSLLNPFAPHMTEQISIANGEQEYMMNKVWPTPKEVKDVIVDRELIVMINGKTIGILTVKETVEGLDLLQMISDNFTKAKEVISADAISKIVAPEGRNLVNFVVKK